LGGFGTSRRRGNGNKTDIHGFELSVSTCSGIRVSVLRPTGRFRPAVHLSIPRPSIPVRAAGLEPFLQRRGILRAWGFQTRVAYAHRGAFLAGLNQTDQNGEPVYTAAYGQLDMRRATTFTKHFSVMFDGINLTSASITSVWPIHQPVLCCQRGFRPLPGRLPRGAVAAGESLKAASFRRRPPVARDLRIGGLDTSAKSRGCVPPSPA